MFGVVAQHCRASGRFVVASNVLFPEREPLPERLDWAD